MSSYISHLHTDLRRTLVTMRGSTHLAKDVPQGLHKEYPRMQRIALPNPQTLTSTLADVLEHRISNRTGDSSIPLTLTECGTLFGLALHKRDGVNKRNYPSGGALYPVETYFVTTALEESGAGVYHYHPASHSLEKLWDLPHSFDIKSIVPKPPELVPSSVLIFTSVWNRSSAKYGDFTYPLALLEAGHMSENCLLVATALGLNTCPLAGFNDKAVMSILDIDENYEQPLQVISVNKSIHTATDSYDGTNE